MPVLRHERGQLEVGSYYVNVRTNKMVEIMEVEMSGNCRVLDVAANFDAPWQWLSNSQISSCLWRRVSYRDERSHDLQHAA